MALSGILSTSRSWPPLVAQQVQPDVTGPLWEDTTRWSQHQRQRIQPAPDVATLFGM